jgi:hypothetical protein
VHALLALAVRLVEVSQVVMPHRLAGMAVRRLITSCQQMLRVERLLVVSVRMGLVLEQRSLSLEEVVPAVLHRLPAWQVQVVRVVYMAPVEVEAVPV